MTRKRILVIVGGGTRHLAPFVAYAKKQKVSLQIASFAKLSYNIGKEGEQRLLAGRRDIGEFDLIYIRLAGKRIEDASLLVKCASAKGIKIVDRFWQKRFLTRLPFPKSLELKILAEAGIPIPPTMFAKLAVIAQRAALTFGLPFVIKGTLGKQGNGVWSPRNKKELHRLCRQLLGREKLGARFVAEPFIRASQRNRILVIGNRAVAAITRPTRWRRRFVKKVNGEYSPGTRAVLSPIPKNDAVLAVRAARALGVDIAGVDIIHEDSTGDTYVLEVNSAPAWHQIKRDTGIAVEEEILRFLKTLISPGA